jgi:phage tail sheath protein FI
MSEYLSPSVFIEEVPSGIKPIQGVGTSTAAFVGHAERGPIGKAVRLANFGQFLARFGGFFGNGYLPYAVKSFFDEGGSICYVVRTAHYAVPGGGSTLEPTATASSTTLPGLRRNGLGLASKVEAAAGIEAFRARRATDGAYLLSFDQGTGNMALAEVGGSSETVAVGTVPAGGTLEVPFPTLAATVVLNDSFDPTVDITADPASYVPAGTGVLDTLSITGVAGDISSIASSALSIDATTPTACVVSVGSFAATFDATALGPQSVTLADGTGGELSISLNVTTAFVGDEAGATIDLPSLANLVLWLVRLTVSAESPGAWGNGLSISLAHEGPEGFSLAVTYRGAPVETIAGLSMDPLDSRFVETTVSRESTYILAANAAATRPPEVTDAALTGGMDGLGSLTSTDFVGDPVLGNGLHALDVVDDVNVVAVPEAVDRDVHVGGMAYCGGRMDCVYLADSREDVAGPDDLLNYKLAQGPYAGGNAFSSKYAALYAPWVWVFDPRTGGRIPIPPSAAVAGRLAATDAARGVHKAAAGIQDGRLRSTLGLAYDFTAADQESLNPRGINVLRRISGVGNVIWGARTVSADPEWRYLNVRRLFLFLEQSIKRSTTWVVFEPNGRSLWKSVERNVSAFLKLQWLQGALVGDTEQQAYYVKCDEETNPPESVDLGRVITEIGVAPSKPAEFVVFRISQFAAGPATSE